MSKSAHRGSGAARVRFALGVWAFGRVIRYLQYSLGSGTNRAVAEFSDGTHAATLPGGGSPTGNGADHGSSG